MKISLKETNDNAELFTGKGENLDPRTIFYLVMNPKDHSALLNEYCQKNKLELPKFSITEVRCENFEIENFDMPYFLTSKNWLI